MYGAQCIGCIIEASSRPLFFPDQGTTGVSLVGISAHWHSIDMRAIQPGADAIHNVVSRLGLEPRALALKWQANNALFLLISQDVQCLFRQLNELPRTARNSQGISLFKL